MTRAVIVFTLMLAMCLVAVANPQQEASVKIDSLANDSLKLVELQEIVVKGNLPNTRLKGDAIVTSISGSVLEKAGTAHDVLSKVPGIIKNGDDLEVIGRGKPVYYINGRKVTDEDEIKRLMSDEIAQIEVVTNPGAIYNAQVTSVVRIRTKKRQGEGFSLGAYAKTSQSLVTGKNDPEAQVNVNYRHNNFDVFGMVKEWGYRSHQWSNFGQITNDKVTGAELFRYDGDAKEGWHGIGTHLNGGFNWQISTAHSVGAKIDYAISTKDESDELTNMLDYERGILTEEVNSSGKTCGYNPYSVLVNAYYNGNLGKLNIDLNADYYHTDKNTTQLMNETATTDHRIIETLSGAKNKMFATKLVLSYPIWHGTLSVGTEETLVSRNNTSECQGINLPWSESKVTDNNYAAFLQYAFTINYKTAINVGLRYEHAYFDYKNVLNRKNDLTRNYDNLFPSASVSTMLGETRWSLNYSCRTQRPNFYQLDNSLRYHNRYVLQQGNATLKPSIQNTFGLTAMYKILTIGANYTLIKDLVCDWCEQMNDGGMIRVSFKNIDKLQNQLNVFATATKTFGCYTPSWTVASVKQWLTLDFDNGSRSFNKPMWVFFANNAFRFNNDWQVELNSALRSKANYNNVELTNNYWAVDMAVQKLLLKDKSLTLRLSWHDITRTSDTNVFIDYGNYTVHQANTMDNNRLVLTARYSFNTTKSKYKGTGAGQDARDRM